MKSEKSIMVYIGVICLAIALVTPVSASMTHAAFEIEGYTSPIVLQVSSSDQIDTAGLSGQMPAKIPETIKKYDLVSFDQQGINRLVRSGKGFSVLVRGKEYTVDLTRMNFDQIDDGIDTYVGKIGGNNNRIALFTISESAMVGSASLDDETFYLEPVPLGDHHLTGQPIAHVVYSSKDVSGPEIQIDKAPRILQEDLLTDSENSNAAYSEKSGARETGLTDVQSVVPPGQLVKVAILVTTDNELYRQYQETGTWEIVAQDIIGYANLQFGRNDIRVELNPVSYDTSRRMLLSQHPEISTNPLLTFANIYPNSVLDSEFQADIALYLGGINRIGPDGDSQGESYIFPGGRYAWAQMVRDDLGYTGITAYGRRCVSIHELGHIFGADHENTGGFEQAVNYYDPLLHHTVMWSYFAEIPGIYGVNGYEFSSDDYHGDIMHDNARRIRETRNTISQYANSALYSTVTTIYEPNGRIIPGGRSPGDVRDLNIVTGDTFSFTIRSDSGYVIDQVQVNGQSVPDAGGKEIYILTLSGISQPTTVYATFGVKTTYYRIIPGAGPNGRIEPSEPVSVPAGHSQTFVITPNPGYAIADVRVDGVSRGPVPVYTFSEVGKNSNIYASFRPLQYYTISPYTGPNGRIDPATGVQVPEHGSQTFTITPNPGYFVADVRVDGKSVGAVTYYVFNDVTAPHTIMAAFRQASSGILPLCPAGKPFDSSKYPQNTPQSDPMTFQCYWDGTGQVYISGSKTTLTGTYADDGFSIDIRPSGAYFETPTHWAIQHPPIELTGGMRPGVNTFTLIVRNWMGLSMSYGSSTGIGTDQTPYIVQMNSPIVRSMAAGDMIETTSDQEVFIPNESVEKSEGIIIDLEPQESGEEQGNSLFSASNTLS